MRVIIFLGMISAMVAVCHCAAVINNEEKSEDARRQLPLIPLMNPVTGLLGNTALIAPLLTQLQQLVSQLQRIMAPLTVLLGAGNQGPGLSRLFGGF